MNANGGTTKSNPNRLVSIASLDELEIDTRVRGLATLTEDEARALTQQIQRTSVRLWMLVTEAHDRKAHIALGYETWADYVKAELNMSESRSYQFLDTGHVMKALAAGGADIETLQPPPTRVVARVKDRLTEVRNVAKKAMSGEGDIDKAIRALAREPRGPRELAAAASSGGGSAEVIPTRQQNEELVSCPACAGSGKVKQSTADRLLKLIHSKARSRPGVKVGRSSGD